MTIKTVSDRLSWHDLTEMLECESLDARNDRMWFNAIDSLTTEEFEAICDSENEEIGEQCDEDHNKYKGAIEYVAVKLFHEHMLELILVDEEGKEEYFVVEPMNNKTWEDAATCLIETIHGVGYFGFPSVEDFVLSGPYDDVKQAVLNHLHHIPSWVGVYEGGRAKFIVERRMR